MTYQPYPELLTDEEGKKLLEMSESLWDDLQRNNIGGFSGVNRPFYIFHEFRRVIEQFGRRDVGLNWSQDDLDAAKAETPWQQRLADSPDNYVPTQIKPGGNFVLLSTDAVKEKAAKIREILENIDGFGFSNQAEFEYASFSGRQVVAALLVALGAANPTAARR